VEGRTRQGPGANALKREIEVRVVRESRASAEQVFDVLADLRTHLLWAGERQKGTTRLLTLEAPEGPASVGTEFTTTGADPMGGFTDRSVVTEATRPSAFEFVTEARLVTKRGKVADWTNVHRYELIPSASGCRITYTIRIARISSLPAPLALFNVRLLSGVVRKASQGVARRGLDNLAKVAEERVGV
jgi:Polyketide cyclase / dehydrase and lipid transport